MHIEMVDLEVRMPKQRQNNSSFYEELNEMLFIYFPFLSVSLQQNS